MTEEELVGEVYRARVRALVAFGARLGAETAKGAYFGERVAEVVSRVWEEWEEEHGSKFDEDTRVAVREYMGSHIEAISHAEPAA